MASLFSSSVPFCREAKRSKTDARKISGSVRMSGKAKRIEDKKKTGNLIGDVASEVPM